MNRAAASTATLLDALPHAVVLIDGSQRIAAWNHAAEVLYGHPRDHVLGRSALTTMFDADDRDGARVILERVAGGEAWEGDRRVQRADGALLVSSFRVVATGDGLVAWVATDQMDQGLAEQERAVLLSAEHAARERAEEAFGLVEAIITSAPVGIAVFDLDLRYVRVNDAYASLSGVSSEEHLGGRIGDMVPLPPQVGADLRKVVTTGRTIIGRHVELHGAGLDDTRHFTVSYFPVRTTAGVMVGAGATVVEITETKRAEVERARLLAQAEEAQQRLAVLATASTVLTTTMELDELLERLARVLVPAVADWCVIQLLSDAGVAEHVAVAHGDSESAAKLTAFLRSSPVRIDGEGPIAEVFRTGQSKLLRSADVSNALRSAAADRGEPGLASSFSLRSSLIVPIEVRGQTHGVLILSTEDERELTDDDLDLAVEIAHRAALAVVNARAFQQEHQIAETLQRVMLPAAVPSLPGLEIAVRYVAASNGASVGGDWYDVIAFPDGEVGIVVGDVVGHDIAASTTMGQLRSALRAVTCEQHDDPAVALRRVDRLFETLGLTYATCVLGIVDAQVSTLRWSSAGHPPPVLLRDGSSRLLTGGEGVILGVTAGADAVTGTVELHDDDVLVLYTDGLIERRTESLQEGLDRLLHLTAGLSGADPDSLADGLLAAMRADTDARDDDIAILVARVRAGGRVKHELDLTASASSARVARHFAADVLDRAGWGEQVPTAVLLVSELVTNAVEHGRPPCRLHIDAGADAVEISVEDADPSLPQRLDPDPLDEHGRGYLLVDALSNEWGVRRVGAGKAAWFRLDR